MTAEIDIIKRPVSELDYGFDYEDWLNGDIITVSTWSVPTNLTKLDEYFNDTQAVIWLSGGVLGETYIVTNTVTTLGGRKDSRSLLVIMRKT